MYAGNPKHRSQKSIPLKAKATTLAFFLSFFFFQLDSRAHQFDFKFYLDDKFVKLAPSKHLATPVTKWRQSPWWGQQVPFPFYLWMSDFMNWQRVYSTPGKHWEPDWTEMLHLHFVILMEGDLISSIIWLRQLSLPERIYQRNSKQLVAPSSEAAPEWQFQVCREAAPLWASVPGMAQLTMWTWWQCPMGEAASLGCGQGTVVPLTDAPSPVGRGKWPFPTTHREATKMFHLGEKPRHQEQEQWIKTRGRHLPKQIAHFRRSLPWLQLGT